MNRLILSLLLMATPVAVSGQVASISFNRFFPKVLPEPAPVVARDEPTPFELRFLHCGEAIETPRGQRVGKNGELGRMQMTRASRMIARTPLGYLRWLEKTVPDPTPYRLALAWNAGPTGMQNPSDRQTDHAQRLANLFYDRSF